MREGGRGEGGGGGGGGAFLRLSWNGRRSPRHSGFVSGFAFYQCDIMASG